MNISEKLAPIRKGLLEFEQAFADRREFFTDVHGFRQLPWSRKVLE